MANDLNYCSFIGRLGRDPEIRSTTGGDAIASFSVGVGRQWKDKTSGEKREDVEWVNVTVFGALAKVCGDYLHKGSRVFISGRMKTEKYQDKNTGTDRYSTKIIASEMQLLDAKPSGNSQGGSRSAAPEEKIEDFEDSIPF